MKLIISCFSNFFNWTMTFQKKSDINTRQSLWRLPKNRPKGKIFNNRLKLFSLNPAGQAPRFQASKISRF